MPKANLSQTNFSSGEVSPLLRGRIDTTKYANGAETVENFFVLPQGGLRRRPGTKFVDFPKHQSLKARMVRFGFSNSENYVMEFGDLYLRIWRLNETPLTTVSSTHSVSTVLVQSESSTGGELTAAHGLSGSKTVYLSGFVGTYKLNGQLTTATFSASVVYSIDLSTLGQTYVSGGTIEVLGSTAIEVVTPYSYSDLDQLNFAQSADVVYITHPHYQPRKILRTSIIAWSLATVDTVDGPYMSIDSRDISMTLSAVTDSATMVATGTPFVAGDVNEYVEFQDKGVWQLAQITGFTSTSQVTVDIIGNTLVDLDPTVVLTPKTTTTAARSISDERVVGTQQRAPFGKDQGNRLPQTGYGSSKAFGKPVRAGVDPAAVITRAGAADTASGAANIDASYANTFSRNDVGKYLRTNTRIWRQITAFNTHQQVACGANVTYMAATPAASTLSIVPGSRAISATLTASSAVFAASDVGRHVRLNYNSVWVWCKISAYTSSTVVTVTLYDEPPTDPIDNSVISNNGRTVIWRLGSWSNTTGWPQAVTFHEQRLVFAATRTEPQSIWFSRSGDFEVFSPSEVDSTVLDDNGIGYSLASGELNTICWLQSGTVLLIGTSGGEWQARAASSVQEPITPANISITPQTYYGSIDYARPVKIGSSVLFIQRTGTKLIELSYSFEDDGWVGRDLTLANEHILKGAAGTTMAKELAWCAEPFNLLFVRLADGSLACLTYNKDQEIAAWHKHGLGNSGIIEWMCSVPSSDNTTNDLWMTVKRTISAADSRTIEKLIPSSRFTSDAHVDVALTGVSSITGLSSRLYNQTVEVNSGANATLGTFVVSGAGVVTLSGSSDVDYYGYPYTATLKTLPPEGGSAFGSSQGRVKRGARATIRVYSSVSVFHGPSASPTVSETFSATPFTGDHSFQMNQDYNTDAGYYLTQSRSLPLTILAWCPQLHTHE